MPNNTREIANQKTSKPKPSKDTPSKSSRVIEFFVSWLIIIGVIAVFVWLNDNYLHLPINGSDECSGMYEHHCGDPENINIDDPTERPDYR